MNKTKEQQLIKAIQTACPDIMDLVMGCKFDVDGIIFVHSDIPADKELKSYAKILGRDIYIGDVLRAMSRKNEEWRYVIALDGHILKHNTTYESGDAKFEMTGIYWNLKLPLSKQKPEVWAFLYELLIKDNK